MLLISENKKMQAKKTYSNSKRKGPAKSKSEKVLKLVDPDNEKKSLSNSNVDLVISDIATPKMSYPNPLPNQYVLGILQFFQKQVSICYGFSCNFYINFTILHKFYTVTQNHRQVW